MLFRRNLFVSGAAALVLAGSWVQAAPAFAQERAYTFDIPAGPLANALRDYARATRQQLLFTEDLTAGKAVPALRGPMPADAALQQLLSGTGLVAVRTRTGALVLQRVGASPQGEAAADAVNVDQVVVTGSRIRGAASPSPVVTIGAERIQQEGFSDLGEVIRSVPQNFAGGQNPGVQQGAAAGGPSNQNITGGSGLNLRGLGPDASLTLLNGRRLAYGGFAQGVDISAIPVEAVERLEIVPDGASALYGSDAVGGVANVILRQEFEGVTVGARYGAAADGGLNTREYHVTAGATWATGGLIAAALKSSNDAIFSDQRDYTGEMYRPSTLWPRNDLRSGLVSLHQSVGNAVEFHLDALATDRKMETFLSFGSVYYPYQTKTRTTLIAPSLDVRLPGDWTLTLGGAVGDDKTSYAQPGISVATGIASSSGLGFYSNESQTYELGVEGPVFSLPGGEARLAAGGGYRSNSYLDGSTDGDEDARFAYAELSLPLIGPRQAIAGVERLEFTAAVRTEDGDYGQVTTPKLGLVYAPNADFILKASWGKSFKAPTLIQRFSGRNAIYYRASTFGSGYPADATALWLSGGSEDLRPERAKTWSASLAYHPQALPGLEAELTAFDIDYDERILQPITSYNVFGNPTYAEFVTYGPSLPVLNEAVAGAAYFYSYVGTPFDASTVVALVDGRYVNAAQQRIKGADLSGSYRFDLWRGQLQLRGSVSWIESTQALTAAQNPYALAGTLFFPSKLSGRLGAVWTDGGLTASLFGNYKSGVRDTVNDRKGGSFATVDGMVRYETGEGDGPFANLAFELSGQNLFNRRPPLYAPSSPTYAPYDSTNYSAVGRFLSISVTKHW